MKKFLPTLTALAASLVATLQAKAFMFLYRTGGLLCDNDPTVPELVVKALDKIKSQVADIGAETKQRLTDLEQRSVANDGIGAPRAARKMLSEATDALIEGMKGATSTRTTLEFGAKSLSSTAPGAGGTEQMSVQAQNLGLVSVYHGLLTRLIDLLPAEPITGNAVQYTRITYADGTPPGNAAAKAPELSLKAESEIMTELVTVACPTVAHHVNIARQLLADVPLLRSTIDTS